MTNTLSRRATWLYVKTNIAIVQRPGGLELDTKTNSGVVKPDRMMFNMGKSRLRKKVQMYMYMCYQSKFTFTVFFNFHRTFLYRYFIFGLKAVMEHKNAVFFFH